MWQLKLLSILVSITVLTACTKKMPDSPIGVLELYISTVTGAKSADDKNKLLGLTTGTARADLEKMSNEDFTKQFIDVRYKVNSFKTKDFRQENSGDVSVVYELEFEEHGQPGGESQITNKKIAYLSKDEAGQWKIKETKNVKSFLEKKDDVEILGTDTESKSGS
jgi:hypothetical protein